MHRVTKWNMYFIHKMGCLNHKIHGCLAFCNMLNPKIEYTNNFLGKMHFVIQITPFMDEMHSSFKDWAYQHTVHFITWIDIPAQKLFLFHEIKYISLTVCAWKGTNVNFLSLIFFFLCKCIKIKVCFTYFIQAMKVVWLYVTAHIPCSVFALKDTVAPKDSPSDTVRPLNLTWH